MAQKFPDPDPRSLSAVPNGKGYQWRNPETVRWESCPEHLLDHAMAACAARTAKNPPHQPYPDDGPGGES